MAEEVNELREMIRDIVKGMVSYDDEEPGVDKIMELVEKHHHCASCDMHACGDLTRPPLTPESLFFPIKEVNPHTGKPWTEVEKREVEVMRALYLDRTGEPISRVRWEELQDDPAYVRIGATELRAGTDPEIRMRVSTVWSGLNTGSKEIFESVVFRNEKEIDRDRYRTEIEAVEGHNELVGQYFITYAASLPGPQRVRELEVGEQ